ncbi:MAG: hypothetical protein GC159_20975 [Phycisphaera sp.]|nr:hypothetical protein [Phycisphaera sp.]
MTHEPEHHDDRDDAPDTPETVDELINAVIDGSITDGDMARLDAMLAEGDTARERYVEALMAHAMLRVELRAHDVPIALARPIDADGEAELLAPRRLAFRWTRVAAAAAVLLVAGVTFRMITSDALMHRAGETKVTHGAVATLTDTTDATWADDAASLLTPGAELDRGPLHLKAGVAQIVMRSGAVVELVGPTTFHVTGPNAGRLDSGRIVARVPHSAIGFAVVTPHTTVTDLGTEFGLIADADDKSTQVHVFKGRVEMNSTHVRQQLEAGQATSVDNAGAKTIASDPLAFLPGPTYAADVLRTRPIGYWRFDGMTGGEITNVVNPDAPAKMVGPSQLYNGPEIGPRVDAVKRTNTALHLEGNAYAVVGDFAAFERTDRFSYGGWVRPHTGPEQHAILSRMDAPTAYRGYDLLIADGLRAFVHISSHFPGNAIRVRTAPMTPDAWHHVMVTYDGSSMAAGVRVYIDGGLVPTEVLDNNLTGSIKTEVPFVLCRRTGASQTSVPALVQGEVDELVIYDRELTGDEVRVLAGSKVTKGDTR